MVDKKITGLMIYYYYICKRKLWFSHNEISMENENENVSIGKFIDENSYKSERKQVLINNEINIDFVESSGVIHEIKKSRKIETASIWQVKYYLYYLEKLGIEKILAKIDYPLLKKSIDVNLTDDDRRELNITIDAIWEILECERIPDYINSKICDSCAFQDLCRV